MPVERKQMPLRLPPDLAADAAAQAEKEGVSLNRMIERAISDYLKRNQVTPRFKGGKP